MLRKHLLRSTRAFLLNKQRSKQEQEKKEELKQRRVKEKKTQKKAAGLLPSRICGRREMQGYGCNIKSQQYCSRLQSLDTRKIRRGHDDIRRLLPFWRSFALQPASLLQKESWNSKWLSRDREPLYVGNPTTPSRAHSTCTSLRSVISQPL